jgi:ammonia channel protein AmtB
MCRPSCCNDSGGQGAGIAAVALIMLAALVAAKIGPIVARIIHVVLDVIRLVTLTTGLVAALAAITSAAIVITRWQLHRRALTAARTRVVTMPTIRFSADHVNGPAGCLACGGTGTVLRAIGSGRYQPGQCPVCEPVTRAV